jgi:hypothetical protein
MVLWITIGVLLLLAIVGFYFAPKDDNKEDQKDEK